MRWKSYGHGKNKQDQNKRIPHVCELKEKIYLSFKLSPN